MRACVRAWAAALKVRTSSDGGERKENDAWALSFGSGQTSADTSAGSAAKRPQRVSAPGREGGRGTARASKGALTHRALSHVQGPVAVAVAHRRGITPFVPLRFASRRVRAFGTVFLERYATHCNSANAGQNAALLFTPCFTRETLFSTKCVANPLFSTLF